MHTRFAPSPTGMLHIGGLRTALFSWLLARSTGGTFSLRIEDTDAERNTPQAVAAILDGMAWAGLDHDGPVVFQSSRIERHRTIVDHMLAQGTAYRCGMTPEELDAGRAAAAAAKRPFLVRSPWRDTPLPDGVPYCVRLKAPRSGDTTFHDLVRGPSRRGNDQMDDMVLMRSDGTPTYMLAVVVDDADIGVDTIVRGDDHYTNTFRQVALINALGWSVPTYAHLPLVHDESGKKLSKRDGKAGLEYYQAQGVLPEALCALLIRLGWDGPVSDTMPIQAIAESHIFHTDGIQRSPGRLDPKRLANLGRQWMQALPREDIHDRITTAWNTPAISIDAILDDVIERSATIGEAIAQMDYLRHMPPMQDKAQAVMDTTQELRASLAERINTAAGASPFIHREQVRAILWNPETNKPDPAYGPAIRAALTGSLHTPPLDILVAALPVHTVIERLMA